MRKSFRTRALVSAGAIALAGATSLLVLAPPASATLAGVTVSTSNPVPVLLAGTNDQPFGSVTFTETAAGDVPAGSDLCITLDGTDVKWDLDGGAPTVAVTGGGSATFTSRVAASLQIHVVTASTAAGATYKINGLRADTTSAATGPVTAKAGNCVATLVTVTNPIAKVVKVDRLSGPDRYATAQAIAEQADAFPCSDVANRRVVVARGDNFPDALAASYEAGLDNSPILLTAPNSVPNETLAALKTLSARSVVVIGGTAAITDHVFTDILSNTQAYKCDGTLAGAKLIVERVAGTDRYETAKAVALRGAAGTLDSGFDATCNAPVATAIVASGQNFPDAISAGPLSFSGGGTCGDSKPLPLLLTLSDSLPTATASALQNRGIQQVILMGGTTAVTNTVKTAIEALGISVIRVSGADRQATAVALAAKLADAGAGGYAGTTTLVARADNFPDALAVGPYAGIKGSPLFLSSTTAALGTVSAAGIKDQPNVTFVAGRLLGGTSALTEAVRLDVAKAIASQP